jgi:uncharacterized membrane protein
MFTTGSKWFFGLGLFSLVLAAAYGWTTGGSGLGPLTMGYHGGVGDHLGYTLLTSIGFVSIFLGLVAVATRDAEPRALAELAGTDAPPVEGPPAHTAYWPVVGAFAAGLIVLGLVISNVMFVAGLLLLLAVLIEWMVLAWSDRATGDPETNRLVRNRLMGPFEVPLAGALIVGGGIFAFSRLFLTSSQSGAVWVATGLAVAVLAVAAVLAAKPRVSPDVIAGLLSLCAVAVIAAGVVAAARGERTIEHHETETEEDDGLNPYYPEDTNTGAVTEATVPDPGQGG